MWDVEAAARRLRRGGRFDDGPHYRLSPAFDLVPESNNTRRRFLALVVGEYGALAIRENLLSRAAIFQLTRERANDVINEVVALLQSELDAILLDCFDLTPSTSAILAVFVHRLAMYFS